MTRREVSVDQDEHDLYRDETLDWLSETEDDTQRIAQAHGVISAAVIVLAPIIDIESLCGLMDHMKACAKSYNDATEGAPQ